MSLNNFVKTIALISVIAFLLVSCDSATESTCGTKMTADTTLILKASGPTNFSLVTPDARKDCHAEFELFFGWADPAKRETDQFKPSLDWTFQVFPGFFYFPAAPAELWEQEDGYWWHAEVSEGAKNQDDEYVQYQIVGTLGSINDEIMIKASIKYVPY
jgi:hypothetical protein